MRGGKPTSPALKGGFLRCIIGSKFAALHSSDQAEEAVSIALADYIAVLDAARTFRDDVAKRLKAELAGKSAKFQDSQQGDEAAGFCDQWEDLDLDDPYLDVGHARRLEDAPIELK